MCKFPLNKTKMSFDTTHITTVHHVPDHSHSIMPGGCIRPHDPPWVPSHPHIPTHDGHGGHGGHGGYTPDVIVISGPSHVIHHDHGSFTGSAGSAGSDGLHICTDQILMK